MAKADTNELTKQQRNTLNEAIATQHTNNTSMAKARRTGSHTTGRRPASPHQQPRRTVITMNDNNNTNDDSDDNDNSSNTSK